MNLLSQSEPKRKFSSFLSEIQDVSVGNLVIFIVNNTTQQCFQRLLNYELSEEILKVPSSGKSSFSHIFCITSLHCEGIPKDLIEEASKLSNDVLLTDTNIFSRSF